MRLRFHSLKHYLDFEWGLTKNLPKDEPEPERNGPAVHIATPMTAYEPVRIGFRTTGPGQGFLTGEQCQTEERPSTTASSTPTPRASD